MMRFAIGAAIVCAGLWSAQAAAGEGADLTRAHLYAGTLAEGAVALAPLAEAGDAEARFGLGLMQLGVSIQDFVGTLLGYGMVTPNPDVFGPMGEGRPGISPEALSYDALRATLQAFVDGIDTARETLVAAAETDGDWVVDVDLARVRLDLNGDGTGSEAESLAAIAAAMAGELMAGPVPLAVPNLVPETTPPPSRGGAGAQVRPPAAETGIGFDRADGFWLAGYTQVLAAQVDFLLAHDFAPTFEAIGHRLFLSPVFPLSREAEAGSLFMDPATDGQIADLIAAIHTINWQVEDPARLARLVERLHAITGFSRRNWDAILAETDDRRELVPSPSQTALDPSAKVTDEMVAAWRETLDTVDRIVDGKLLLPHWRFNRGVSLHAILTEARRTDMVMMLTGLGMVPFLREGPTATEDDFRGANRVFGNDIWSYVFWFN